MLYCQKYYTVRFAFQCHPAYVFLPGKQAGTPLLLQKWSECCFHLISEPDEQWMDSPKKQRKDETSMHTLWMIS